jgi:hypothetical protein
MTFRLDKAVDPGTFVTRPKTFTLMVDDGKLYILYTGPAPAGGGGIIESGVHGIIASKIKKREERIDNGDFRELVKEKHCVLLTKDQITEVNLEKDRKAVTLNVYAGKKKYHFVFPMEVLPRVEELRSLLTA